MRSDVARVRAWRFRTLALAGAIGWVLFALSVTGHILDGWMATDPPVYWLLDWHVYYLGAIDLVERDLYRQALMLPGWPLPTPVFNQPPATAAIAVPFLPFGREIGGLLWLIAGMFCLVFSAVLTARTLKLSNWWAWLGLAFLGYTGVYFFVGHVTLGNVNHIMLAVLAGFFWAHLRGHQQVAGSLLGAAVAIKVWPITLSILLLREKRWQEVRWAIGVVAVQGVLALLWLGPDVIGPMVDSLRIGLPLGADAAFMWTTWLREVVGVPPWVGPLSAAAFLLIPATGRVGIGFGLLAGLSLINNIWNHYLPTFALAALLIASGTPWTSLRSQLRRGMFRTTQPVASSPPAEEP